MKEYHKIKTLWAREESKPHNIIVGKYALPEFELLKDVPWIFTEKVDGTNIRIMWDGNKVSIGGKTDNAQIPATLYDSLLELFMGEANEQIFEQVFGETSVCLYGEGYGAKIQKGGGDYRQDNSFVLFDVKVGDWWLQREDAEDVAKKMDIDIVPILLEGTLQEASDMVAKGFNSQWGEFVAEGLVGTPKTPLLTRRGDRIITKLKHKDFVRLTPTQ